jgi:hypothetical protein
MKTLSILSSFLVLGALAAQAETAAPARSTAQVTLRVEDKTVRPEKVKKKKDDKSEEGKPKTDTVTKSLDISISAAKSITGPLKLVVSWYGRDAVDKKQVMAHKEESEVTLDATKTAKSSITYAYVSTPAQNVKGADGKDQKVEASGQTYSGWLIRAYEGATLVGETASSPTLLKQHDE